MTPLQNKAQYFDCIQDIQMNYPIYPRGIMRQEHDEDFMSPRKDIRHSDLAIDIDKEIEEKKLSNKPYFNFLDKEHIYQLILNYYDQNQLFIKKLNLLLIKKK